MKSTPECGCKAHEGFANAVGSEDLDLATLESQLDAFLAAAPESEDELSFAALDADLAEIDELELDSVGEASLPSLQDLLHVAEQYPGLKITFSF